MQVTNEDARIYYLNIQRGGRNKRAIVIPGKNNLADQGLNDEDFAALKASDYVKALVAAGSLKFPVAKTKTKTKAEKKTEPAPEPVAPKLKKKTAKKKTVKKKKAKKKTEPAEGW